MVTRLWTAFLISLACVSAIAWLAALMRERGLRPVRGLAVLFGRQPKAGRTLLGAFLAAMWAIAGAKPGGRSGDGAPAVVGVTADTDLDGLSRGDGWKILPCAVAAEYQI